MFDKSRETFPIKADYIFLSHCGVSPLYKGAFERIVEVSERQHLEAHLVFSEYEAVLGGLREAAAALLRTSPDNLAFVKNTSEGMNMIANGYPFEPGDQILSFVHEYPANHYPWRLQSQRGVELVLMPDVDPTGLAPEGLPSGWAMEDLEALTGPRTRLVAISHTQFTSGFKADLPAVAAFCKERGIDLVVDAAQSVGANPVYPDELGIGAVVCSGWKWLMGPVGTGLMYTSPDFRAKLEHTMGGAELVRQGHRGFLNHTFDPHPTAKRFEYSTSSIALAAGLLACVQELPLRYGLEAIEGEIQRLHSLLLELIDRDRYTPLEFAEPHRSSILSLACRDDPMAVAEQLKETGNVLMTVPVRGGYLRFAPHFATTDEEVERAAHFLNRVGA